MCGIARGELAGDSKTAHVILVALKKRNQSGFVQRHHLATCVIMPARHHQIGVTLQGIGQPVGLQVPLLETDIDQRDPPPLSFDQRIGGQSRG